MTERKGRPTAFSDVDQRALRAVALQFLVNGAVVATFIPRLPEVRDRVGISIAGLGLLLTAAGAFGLISSAVVGPVIQRFGTRRVVIGGGVALIAALPVIGVARSPLVLLVGFSARVSPSYVPRYLVATAAVAAIVLAVLSQPDTGMGGGLRILYIGAVGAVVGSTQRER